ncbi:hypothetical protein [Corynebacterium bovis]
MATTTEPDRTRLDDHGIERAPGATVRSSVYGVYLIDEPGP